MQRNYSTFIIRLSSAASGTSLEKSVETSRIPGHIITEKDARIIDKHYMLHPAQPPPHSIGVSKEAFNLCDACVQYHGRFCVSKTHGRLYEQWTGPDLSCFSSAQTEIFSTVLRAVADEMGEAMRWPVRGRRYPNQSSAKVYSGVLPSVSRETTKTALSKLSGMSLSYAGSDRTVKIQECVKGLRAADDTDIGSEHHDERAGG